METNNAHNTAALAILRPLIKVLLRNGIAYGAFAELCKKTYVDVGFEAFTTPGKKQTISQVSALTGLTRKEVKRLYELENPENNEAGQRYNRAIRVIAGWLNDAEFLDQDGAPLVLPIEGEQSSFSSLAKKYSGDIPTQAMLSVLSKAGNVEKIDNHLKLVKHAYIPGNDSVEKIQILGTDTNELISTIEHNLSAEPDQLYFQRKVSNSQLKPSSVKQFRTISSEKAQSLLEEMDAWLSEHEVTSTQQAGNTPCKYVSMGIYFYEKDSSQEK